MKGWIGSAEELRHVLRTFGADTRDGKFILAGNIASFLGAGEEITFDETAVCFINGRPVSLVSLLYQTGYGVKCEAL